MDSKLKKLYDLKVKDITPNIKCGDIDKTLKMKV